MRHGTGQMNRQKAVKDQLISADKTHNKYFNRYSNGREIYYSSFSSMSIIFFLYQYFKLAQHTRRT
ncbi:hypothetical protein NL531_31795, partial [Klebsiella pneumoniae]|nr:hypothetical protein [Klebsiella pneumoniae]